MGRRFHGSPARFHHRQKRPVSFPRQQICQSTIGNAFFQVRDFLKSNRKVLFSGTPCQIQGLKKVIRKNSELLITVDIACHSVPSPKVWKSFFRNLIAKNRISDVSGVFMRKRLLSCAGLGCDSFVVESTNTPPLEDSIYGNRLRTRFWKACFPARHVKNALPKIWKAAAISRLEIFGEWKTIFGSGHARGAFHHYLQDAQGSRIAGICARLSVRFTSCRI